MNSYRKTAIIVGVLFITATVATLLSIPLTNHINAPDYLINISSNETQMIIGALLQLINSIAIVGIAVMLFPILKKRNEALALGYVCARIMEAAILVVAVISLLLLLTLSQEFVKAGAKDVSYFQASGTLLVAAHEWAWLLGGEFFLTLSALILNYILYQSRLIPRFISVWGLIGATLLLAQGLLGMFGSLTETSVLGTFLFLPIALQEMVFAVWLIVKGFNPSAIASGSAKTDINEIK
ncbi:DUF4386 domain-containing protein [Chloroflexota bacterium]